MPRPYLFADRRDTAAAWTSGGSGDPAIAQASEATDGLDEHGAADVLLRRDLDHGEFAAVVYEAVLIEAGEAEWDGWVGDYVDDDGVHVINGEGISPDAWIIEGEDGDIDVMIFDPTYGTVDYVGVDY